jgi:hypothetical protein
LVLNFFNVLLTDVEAVDRDGAVLSAKHTGGTIGTEDNVPAVCDKDFHRVPRLDPPGSQDFNGQDETV